MEQPWKRTLWILYGANVVTATGMMAMVPFLTFFVEDLGIEDSAERNRWAGVLVGAAPIAAALMGPIWGGISDRFGRKIMVLRALAAIVIFVGLMGLTHSLWTLLALRLLQGVFSGYVPTSITFASVLAPDSHQGRIAGLLQSSMPAGMVGGYLLGGLLSQAGNIRWIFPICSVLAAISFVVVLLFTHEPRRETQVDPSRGVGALVRGLAKDIGFVLRIPPLMALLGAVVIVRAFVSTVDPSYARFVLEVGGDKTFAGIVMSVQAGMVLIAMPIWGRIGDRLGARRTFMASALGVAVSYAAQAQATTPMELLLLRAAAGTCLAGVFPAAYSLAGRVTPPGGRGAAMGVVFMAVALAHAVGSSIGGGLLNLFGFRRLFLVIAIVVASLSVTGFVAGRRAAARRSRAAS